MAWNEVQNACPSSGSIMPYFLAILAWKLAGKISNAGFKALTADTKHKKTLDTERMFEYS
jgi:hypothetical protein